MYKFVIKFCVIMLCFPLQSSWAWMCSYENNQRPGTLNDMAWHVVTVKANTVNDLKSKIVTITSETTANRRSSQAKAEIVDLSCGKATFTKLGDYCRYRLRMPYTADKDELKASVSTHFKDESGEEHGLCDENEHIEFYFNKNNFISLVRFAVAEEYKFYPALHPSGEQEFAVLVVENGNTKEIEISGITAIRASWLTPIHKTSDSDAFYGDNKECGIKEDAWKVNKLKYVGDSCILVYNIAKAPPLANNPSIEIKMLTGTTPHTELIALAQVLKPMELKIREVEDIGMQRILGSEIPISVIVLTNYYSSDIIKPAPTIEIYDENDNIVNGENGKFRIIPSMGNCFDTVGGCEEFKCNHLTYNNQTCHFRIVPSSTTVKSDMWSEYLALHGNYYIRVSYNGIVSDKVSFKVLSASEVENAAKEMYKNKGIRRH